MNKGKIVQVMGPVVDVVFEDGQLPDIKDALEVENNGKRCVMEVSQHLGNNIVRCIMLGHFFAVFTQDHTVACPLCIRLLAAYCADVVQKLMPETGIQQMQRRMLHTAVIPIDRQPVIERLFCGKRAYIVRITIA